MEEKIKGRVDGIFAFRSRGSRVEAKKGKGAKYNRGREKDKARKEVE